MTAASNPHDGHHRASLPSKIWTIGHRSSDSVTDSLTFWLAQSLCNESDTAPVRNPLGNGLEGRSRMLAHDATGSDARPRVDRAMACHSQPGQPSPQLSASSGSSARRPTCRTRRPDASCQPLSRHLLATCAFNCRIDRKPGSSDAANCASAAGGNSRSPGARPALAQQAG
jgi:hypothetical protein